MYLLLSKHSSSSITKTPCHLSCDCYFLAVSSRFHLCAIEFDVSLGGEVSTPMDVVSVTPFKQEAQLVVGRVECDMLKVG